MKRHALIFGTILIGWVGVAAAAMLPGSIPTAMIPAGSRLPDGVTLIDQRGPLLVVQSDDPSYVRALYAHGAAFVLPARKKTCLDIQG